MMEFKVLKLATETKNPHLLGLRCAYQQNKSICFVTYPWCEFDLSVFLDNSNGMKFWVELTPKSKLILITDWMACLASGLSALHKNNIKHQNLKPENVLLCTVGASMMPVICDFGLSKGIEADSESVEFQDYRAYFPPEQYISKFGRKGDVFSMGLIFIEVGLLMLGQSTLKHQIPSGVYIDIVKDLNGFLIANFPCLGGTSTSNSWCTSFQKLLTNMLNEVPANRPRASQVFDQLREIVTSLGAAPHCEITSPCVLDPDLEEENDDIEIVLKDNFLSMISE